MKKKSPIIIILVIILAILVIAVVGLSIYNSNLKGNPKDDEIRVVEIKEGSTISSVADQLKSEGLIKNTTVFKLYTKLNHSKGFQAGTYGFAPNMGVKKIVKMLENGEVYTGDEITFTYIEGKPMWWLASEIEKQTNNSADSVYALLKDENYINSIIEKYWFITNEIKNPDIYYPLEGYLFPDTYIYRSKDVTVEEIFEKMLDQMELVLADYQSEINDSPFSIHKLLSFASVVEAESMDSQDRAGIAGVFYNRLNIGMALGSDPTTYYAIKVDPHSRELTYDELNDDNPYNTRGPGLDGKIQVGPICSVSRSSIEATLRPKEFDALFFVADKHGNTYFTNTNEEHEQKIQEIKDAGDWFDYED